MGQHFLLLTEHQMRTYLATFYVSNASYPCSATFIKLALLFQYLRLFEKGTRLYRTTLAAIGLVVCWGLGFGIAGWVPCIPVRAFWDVSEEDATCWGFGSYNAQEFVATYVALTSSNVALDIITLVIPMSFLFATNTHTHRTRYALMGLFGMGCL